MSLKKILSKSNRNLAMCFIPSAGAFGLAAFLGLCYFTDWRLVTNYIPLYNTKYPKEEKK